jgi:hypothetical protein
MKEEWRVIPGYSRYEASSRGRVRRPDYIYRTPPGLVSVGTHRDGYPTVTITGDDGVNRKLFVHTVVCAAFLGRRPKGKQVCHHNGIKTDNRIRNLRYDTRLGNKADDFRNGVVSMGEEHYAAKITIADALSIYARCAKNEDHAAIAGDYGLSRSSVSNICRRKTWKVLGLPRITVSRKHADRHPACAGLFETRRR